MQISSEFGSPGAARIGCWPSVVLGAPFGLVVGGLVFWQTASINCAHHTIDACLPTAELLLGGAVAATVCVWFGFRLGATFELEQRAHRTAWRLTRSSTLPVVALAVALGVWFIVMRAAGPRVCAVRETDYVCGGGLVLGAVTIAAVLVLSELFLRLSVRGRLFRGR